MKPKLRPYLFLFAFIATLNLQAQFAVSKLFTDHMVIQRGQSINVWGWGDPGAAVSVAFAEQVKKTKIDAKGKWMVEFPAMKAGGPHAMSIYHKGTVAKTISDIMLGDVWICSGQSNMEWVVRNSNDADNVIQSADDPMIRHFKVPRTTAEEPEEQLAGGEWQAASPETVADFTAVGYFFAQELRKSEGVAIGLLNTSWGGSRVEPWMRAEILGGMNVKDILAERKAKAEAAYNAMYNKLKQNFPHLSKEVNDQLPAWTHSAYQKREWASINPGALWEGQGYQGLDGIVWYRKTFKLEKDQLGQDLELGLGKIDDSDLTWVNGQKIGETIQQYSAIRKYSIPATLLKEGENTILVRVEDTGGGGGMYGESALFYVKGGSVSISLTDNWEFAPQKIYPPQAGLSLNHTPTLLYNKMIHPLLNFPIKGAIWYQGESNTGDADEYEKLFSDMIIDWRKLWGVGDFPFLFVQLANFMAPSKEPAQSNWAELREAQSGTLKVPNTGQAVIIDIGEADDIHPRNKQDVGLRLAYAARKLAYGEKIVYSGPVYKSHTVKGNKMILSFDHIGSGLDAKNPYAYVNAFAVAGADGKFHWAKALIKGDKIEVWSDKVAKPTQVRYAWANNPHDANLYNKEGIPASPFRSKK